MRRLTAVACGLACLVLPAPASAAITTTTPTLILAGGGQRYGASFVEQPGTGTPHGTADAAIAGFPTESTAFSVLTSGNAAIADGSVGGTEPATDTTPGQGFEGAEGNAYDVSDFSIALNVPAGVNGLSLDFKFLSQDASSDFFNDAFLATLGGDWSWSARCQVAAPSNFAFDGNGALASARGGALTTDNATGTGYTAGTRGAHCADAGHAGRADADLVVFDVGDENRGVRRQPAVSSRMWRQGPAIRVERARQPGGFARSGHRWGRPITALFSVGRPASGPRIRRTSRSRSTRRARRHRSRPVSVGRSASTWAAQPDGLAPGDLLARVHRTDAAWPRRGEPSLHLGFPRGGRRGRCSRRHWCWRPRPGRAGVGGSTSVTGTLRDSDGSPIPGAELVFAVGGANSTSASAPRTGRGGEPQPTPAPTPAPTRPPAPSTPWQRLVRPR